MNHDDATKNSIHNFDFSTRLERDINDLSQIFTAMRALELTHVIDPRDRDPADYKMLVDDMAATLRHLTRTLLTAEHQDNQPAVISAHDFPPDNAHHPSHTTAIQSSAAPTPPRSRGPSMGKTQPSS